MARNLNRLKLARAERAQAAITNRQPAQPAGAVYLMQLRSQTEKTSALKHRIQIVIEPCPELEVSRPVKIIHADSNQDTDLD